MSVTIPAEVLEASRMSEAEMRQEIAAMLFQKEKLTLAQASRLAGMNLLRFQHLLSSRGIEPHYGVEELEQDLRTLRELGRL
jgi:predicted HTH domain antitoxin